MLNIIMLLIVSCGFLITAFSLLYFPAVDRAERIQKRTSEGKKHDLSIVQLIFLGLRYILFFAIGIVFCYFSYLFWLHSTEFQAQRFAEDAIKKIYGVLLADKSVLGGHFILALFKVVIAVLYLFIIFFTLIAHSIASIFMVIFSAALFLALFREKYEINQRHV